MKILCFGSEMIKEDKLALEIADELGVETVKCTHADDVLKFRDEKEITILDVAKGIDEVKVIDDLNKLKNKNIISLHDFDLAEMLKIMKEVYNTKVKIIAIPYGVQKEKAIKEVKKILNAKGLSRA